MEAITLSVNRWERVTPPLLDLDGTWAAERGLEVRRVDLARLLTGQLHETAQRVDRLLAEAESAGTVLLFDEAEALFDRRTQVQDALDRYQATELDAVMDRLARFRGPVLVLPPADPPTGPPTPAPDQGVSAT